jgi:hypothetical protein
MLNPLHVVVGRHAMAEVSTDEIQLLRGRDLERELSWVSGLQEFRKEPIAAIARSE